MSLLYWGIDFVGIDFLHFHFGLLSRHALTINDSAQNRQINLLSQLCQHEAMVLLNILADIMLRKQKVNLPLQIIHRLPLA